MFSLLFVRSTRSYSRQSCCSADASHTDKQTRERGVDTKLRREVCRVWGAMGLSPWELRNPGCPCVHTLPSTSARSTSTLSKTFSSFPPCRVSFCTTQRQLVHTLYYTTAAYTLTILLYSSTAASAPLSCLLLFLVRYLRWIVSTAAVHLPAQARYFFCARIK